MSQCWVARACIHPGARHRSHGPLAPSSSGLSRTCGAGHAHASAPLARRQPRLDDLRLRLRARSPESTNFANVTPKTRGACCHSTTKPRVAGQWQWSGNQKPGSFPLRFALKTKLEPEWEPKRTRTVGFHEFGFHELGTHWHWHWSNMLLGTHCFPQYLGPHGMGYSERGRSSLPALT